VKASRSLRAAMVTILAVYVVVLLLPIEMPPWLRDGVLGNLVLALPAAVLLHRGRQHPADRSWTLPLAAGVSLYVLANIFYTVSVGLGSQTFPSPADVGYLGCYPFLLAGLLLALREHLRGVRLIVALDGLGGTLAGGAVATYAIAPLIDKVWDGSIAAATTLAYPVCAVVVIAASLGALGIVGTTKGWQFVVWVVGMIVFGVGDITYSYELAFGHYHAGGLLDASWPIGLAMAAAGATSLTHLRQRPLPGPRSLIVVAVAAASTVVVLAVAPAWAANPAPSVLALMTLAVCAVRLALAFLQLRELAVVRQQALTDELTGAANRRALHAALDRQFQTGAHAGAQTGVRDEGPAEQTEVGFGLALIDLDHFKEVNDSFGHAAGDDLLRTVVTRFAAALDQLQMPHLLARLGGDEFAVILFEVDSRESAMACGKALQESLLEPVLLDDVALHVQASVGVAVAPDHARNRGDMLFAADAAMYAAKSSGEAICLYSPATVGDRRRRLEVAEDLYSALDRGELMVEYQPIMSASGELVGAEALVRWDHPARGRLSPGEFLEIAERYRLTPSIAQRVLDVALTDLHRWRATGAPIRISVNVSASDLHDETLVDSVASALLTHDVPPSALTIEITETAMMRNPEMAHTVMHALDDLGVQLAVDDYGTGYSSLEYLLKLPINEIKLDRAFSADLVTELRSVAIVRSTVDLTHALGLRMVAEGVENEHTLAILQDLGCDLVQGWHLGRPMSATAFEQLIEDGAADRPASTGGRPTELAG
jgi:diguanylate cyclase